MLHADFNAMTPEQLRAKYPRAILATYLVGSRAYGAVTATSDEDYRGIFMLPAACYLSVAEPVKQISDAENNVTYYTLKRFMELAMTANPNIVEMLFMPDDCRVFEAPAMEMLLAARGLFITKQAYDSHVNYAMAQLKKAKGKNRWVNNPQPETPPDVLDFCWFLPRENVPAMPPNENAPPSRAFPFRPIPIKETPVDLQACVCAKLEQANNTYRLYRDPHRCGVFRNGMLVCESISFRQEREDCLGLLIYNRVEHERAMRDHTSYWQWRTHRNPARWQADEANRERDYDAKNMMHVFRLLLSGEQILRAGEPLVRFTGEKLQFLYDIREGRFTYEHLMEIAEQKFAELSAAVVDSSLPQQPDVVAVDDLLREMTQRWERETFHGQ